MSTFPEGSCFEDLADGLKEFVKELERKRAEKDLHNDLDILETDRDRKVKEKFGRYVQRYYDRL